MIRKGIYQGETSSSPMPEHHYHVDLPPSLEAMGSADRRKAIDNLRRDLVNTQPRKGTQGNELRQVTTGFHPSEEFPSEGLVKFFGEQPRARAVIEALGMRVFDLIVAQIPPHLLEDREKQSVAIERLCEQLNERLRKTVTEGTPEDAIPHVRTRIPEKTPTVFHTKAYGENTGAYVRSLYGRSKITVLGA